MSKERCFKCEKDFDLDFEGGYEDIHFRHNLTRKRAFCGSCQNELEAEK